MPRWCAHRPPGKTHARLPVGLLRHPRLSRFHYRPEGECPRTGGRPPSPRRDRELHQRSRVRRRSQSSPTGTLRRQCRLPGRPSHDTQLVPLDWTHRSGRDGGNHQNLAATLPFFGRKDHPLRRQITQRPPRRSPWETRFVSALVRLRAIPLPTRRLLQGYLTSSQAWAGRAPYLSRCQRYCRFVFAGPAGSRKSPSLDCHTRQQAISAGIEHSSLALSPLASGLTLPVASLRWIRG